MWFRSRTRALGLRVCYDWVCGAAKQHINSSGGTHFTIILPTAVVISSVVVVVVVGLVIVVELVVVVGLVVVDSVVVVVVSGVVV